MEIAITPVRHIPGVDELDGDAVLSEAAASEQPADEGKRPASALLIELATERYNFGVTEDGQPFAVRPGGHVVRMLRGGKNSLRAELAKLYYRKYGRAAPQQPLAEAILTLEGMACDENPSSVHLRVGAADGAVWLDLGDVAETVVRVDATGWRLASSGVPVLFRRTELTGVMPQPQHGGDLNDLWVQLNIAPADRPLVLAWMVAAIVDPDMPHPIMSLFGEQGTGKTTACGRIVGMVDPSPVPLRKPPRDADSWVTAAAGSWVVALDNMSQVHEWLSDSLCRAATGEGDVKRALYTDGQLAVFAFRRCILLNGIDVGALRGDLADRLVLISVERISETARLTERHLNSQWRDAHPKLLGALLTLAAGVAGVLPSVQLDSSPRMADFAVILAAVDQILGTTGYQRFTQQAKTMAADTLSADPFLAAMDKTVTTFTGTAAELLTEVTPVLDWRPPRGWPKDARAVTSLLKRNAPALRKAGWTVEDRMNRDSTTEWTLEAARNPSPQHPHRAGLAGVAGMAGNEYGQSLQDLDLCQVCTNPMPARLIAAGEKTHPNCDPELTYDWNRKSA